MYNQLINLYFIQNLTDLFVLNKFNSNNDFVNKIPLPNNEIFWENIGGQLMPIKALTTLKQKIKLNKITCWDEVHEYYNQKSLSYKSDVLQHAVNVFCKLHKVKKINGDLIIEVLKTALQTKTLLTKNVYESRAKDYSNPFRKMVYDTNEEMNLVLGKLEDNSFILEEQERLKQFSSQINTIIKHLKKG
jgi:hypothetical protein